MSDLGDFLGTLRINFDNSGTDAAKAAIDSVGSSSKDTDELSKRLVVTLQDVQSALGGIKNEMMSFITEAANNELSWTRLQKAVENTGLSWTDSKVKIDDYVSSLKETTNLTDDQLVGALQRTIQFTGNLSDGLRAAKLSVDMAASGMFGLDQATRLVSMATEGNVAMLGRFIPELKSATNEELKGMDAHQKADYALGLLQARFGGMAANELKTTAGQMKLISTNTTELKEAIGTQLLPTVNAILTVLNSWAKEAIQIINNHRELFATISALIMSLSALVLGFGSLSFAIGVAKVAFTSLSAVITSNPIGAIAIAFAALTATVYAYMDATQKTADANTHMGKTHQDLINIQKEELKQTNMNMAAGKMYNDQGQILAERKLLLEKSIQYQELQLEREKQSAIQETVKKRSEASIKNQQDTENSIVKEMAALKQKQTDHDKYYKELEKMGMVSLQQQRVNLEAEIATVKDGTARKAELMHELFLLEQKMSEANNYTLVGGFKNAIDKMLQAQHNWGDDFTKMLDNIQSATTSDLADILKGGISLADGLKKIWEDLENAIINSLVNAVAQEIVQHTIIDGLRKLWKVAQITDAAEVGAANAAAATAWSLWGAIGIGIAIGAAIMAFSNAKFEQGGFVPGNSFTGDKVVASLNSGEFVSNTAQQQRLLDLANGKSKPDSSSGSPQGGDTFVFNIGNIDENNINEYCRQIAEAIKSDSPEGRRLSKVIYKKGSSLNGETV